MIVRYNIGGKLSVTAGTPKIYVLDSNGRGLKRLTKFTADSPEWSPDGEKIVYG